MPRSSPAAAKKERLALGLIILGLLAALLAGLKPLNRDPAYPPLLLALLLALSLYQLALRPGAAVFALSVLVPVPGLFVYLHYYSAVALLPAFALTAKVVLAACLYRALWALAAAVLPPRNAGKVRLAAALALPPLAVTVLFGRSILLLTALTLTGALFAAYCGRLGRHD